MKKIVKKFVKKNFSPAMQVSLIAWYGYFFGEREIRSLKRLCNNSKISIDVGANVGLISYHLRRLSLRCAAFEPNPSLCLFLEEAFGETVDVYKIALSDFVGEAKLTIPIVNGKEIHTDASIFINPDQFLNGDQKYEKNCQVEVPVATLDSLNFEQIGFIKIDVEGNELSVLKGAEQVLKNYKPNLLIEIEERHRNGALASVEDFLRVCGYRGFFDEFGVIKPIGEFRPDLHQNLGELLRADVRDRRDIKYINNFIFVPFDRVYLLGQ